MVSLRAALFLLFLSIAVTGCSWLPFRSQDPLKGDLSAETLLSRGDAEFDNKKYSQAIKYFQKLKDEFPFAPQAGDVELKLGEAYYKNKQYAEATASFKDFLALHPTHGSVAFAVYHLGLIHFDQFNGIERDQKNTEIAKGYFESVARDYSTSPYAGPAKEKLAQSLRYLAERELAIAAFYQREGKYPAARERLETVLKNYRDTPAAAKALYRLGEIYRQEKNSGKAGLAYEALIQHYPQDALSKEARVQLVHLEKSRQDPLETLLARDNGAASPSPQSGNPPVVVAAPKETPMVAKKEVVYEEPGENKGIVRRAAESLNPLDWFSSEEENGDKRKEEKKPIETAKNSGSPGLLSSLWPGRFGKKTKEPVKTDPELVAKVDKGLELRGAAPGVNPEVSPPAVNLPQVENEPQKGIANTAALLGGIDARLKSQGKDVAELPAAPEGLALPATATSRPSAKTAVSTTGLLGSIDQALQQKGIEPPKENIVARSQEALPPPQPPSQIQLEPKLTVEKGPLFLETGEYQPRLKNAESDEARKPEGREASQPSNMPASQLPQAVIQGPSFQQSKEKPSEIKTAEKKKADGKDQEEETKGLFDQIKEDMEGIGRVLNPFKW